MTEAARFTETLLHDEKSPAEGVEFTTTVVIGSGLSGLAVASELSRQGVSSVVLESSDFLGPTPVTAPTMTVPNCLAERGEILRVLRHYASNHHVDVRSATKATGVRFEPQQDASGRWVIATSAGTLVAQNVVFTRCALNQLRRFLSSIGIALGQDLPQAIRTLGLYLVGVGNTLTPHAKEIFREARAVSDAITLRVNVA